MTQKTFGGPVLFLDRDDINTDEIIPAKYLTEVEKQALQPHMLEDLQLDGFSPDAPKVAEARVIVTRGNFGCGSSREHAPWVFEVNGVHTIIAESYARIFRQNMFNGGMLALELPKEKIDQLFDLGRQSEVEIAVDVPNSTLVARNQQGQQLELGFDLSPFDRSLVEAGGWVEFADARY